MSESNINSIRVLIFGLLTECPYDNSSSVNCIIHDLRKLSITDKFEYMEKLSSEDCIELYKKHKQCLHSKEV